VILAATILIIDNDYLMRSVLTICLHDAGWNVLSYAYDDIRLAVIEQIQPDLIILNFTKQNGGDGWQFLQMLKMEDTLAHIPILVTTTVYPLATEMHGYLLTRYIQIVYQPFDRETLIQLIHRTLTQVTQAGVLMTGDRTHPILVVEDTDDLRESLEMVLLIEGYHVVTAINGLLALEAVYRADHSLIFLDIRMPVMDGFEFLRLYEQQFRPHSPVIIVSGEAGLEARVFPSFVVEVLPKPYEMKHLVRLAEKYTQAV
jgi:two-component system, chemotaxis family, chemotaxis protein CheY